MKNIFVALFFTFLVSGCVTVGAKQSECEQKYSSFAQIVSCTKLAFANDSRASRNSEVKLYFLKGDQLVEKVNKGEISELDAKTEWQALYVQLKAEEAARRPKFTNCYSNGGNVNCTTY